MVRLWRVSTKQVGAVVPRITVAVAFGEEKMMSIRDTEKRMYFSDSRLLLILLDKSLQILPNESGDRGHF